MGQRQVRISARSRIAAGFSMIELMVVIFIIGLAASVVVLTLPDTGRDVEDDARDFATALRTASQESILTGAVIGVEVLEHKASFYRYRAGIWESIAQSSGEGGVGWPDNTYVFFYAGGERIKPASGRGRDADEAGPRPQIVFEPTGLNTAFAMVFERDGIEVSVTGNEAGDITVTRSD